MSENNSGNNIGCLTAVVVALVLYLLSAVSTLNDRVKVLEERVTQKEAEK